jgi:hypothetical protein
MKSTVSSGTNAWRVEVDRGASHAELAAWLLGLQERRARVLRWALDLPEVG